MTRPQTNKQRIGLYLDKDLLLLLNEEVKKSPRPYGEQSRIIEEALREYLRQGGKPMGYPASLVKEEQGRD